ncbi:MAG: CPBP family glutamic-type intramembrane protease [Xenococcaceae cyanobacterium MO_188.B19]|nr:CPBP family glutamic-type intramembrane protease [Xenococcaceae cyanobacterium MO_188.B19]
MISNLYIIRFIDIVIQRVIWGFSNLPTVNDWLNGIILILVYAVIALPVGFWLNFLQLDIQYSGKIVIKIMTTSFIAPAILEELVFRVVLLPQSSEYVSFKALLVYSIISLLLFIIYHPLNGITFFPAGRKTFFNPVFLFLAALLGLICTIAYLRSGSIWISVVIHWLTVVTWLLCFGGMKKLKITQQNIQ